jgi:NAD dependent epimerase/dehydratase family enzyme
MKLDGLLIGLKIPDWLTPGSPTPFEMGIRGVSSAMQDAVNQSLPQFQAKLSMVGTASPVQSASQNQTPSLSNADGFDFDYNRLARAIRDGLLTSGMAN